MSDYSEDIKRRMSYGTRCDSEYLPGWALLIENLNSALAKLVPDYTIDHIKEKFGTLRFYCDVGNIDSDRRELVYDLLGHYEGRSATMCELCGELASLRSVSKYYIRTLCDKHAP